MLHLHKLAQTSTVAQVQQLVANSVSLNSCVLHKVVRKLAHMDEQHQMTLPGLTPQWTLGDRLRKAREIAGLSQGEMAEAIGIARNSVGRYESGSFDPSRPVLIAWAFRTGVALDWIMAGVTGATAHSSSSHRPTIICDQDSPPSTKEVAALVKRIPLTPTASSSSYVRRAVR